MPYAIKGIESKTGTELKLPDKIFNSKGKQATRANPNETVDYAKQSSRVRGAIYAVVFWVWCKGSMLPHEYFNIYFVSLVAKNLNMPYRGKII